MVGLVDYIQQMGASGTVNEIEASHASRTVLRPQPDVVHGSYSATFATGPVTHGNGTGNYFGNNLTGVRLAGLQWVSPVNLFVLKKCRMNFTSTSTVACAFTLQMFKASGYSRQFDQYVHDSSTAGNQTYQWAQTFVLGQGAKLRNSAGFVASDLGSFQPSGWFSWNPSTTGVQLTPLVTVPISGFNPGGQIIMLKDVGVSPGGAGIPPASAGLFGGVFTLEPQAIGGVCYGNQPTAKEYNPMKLLFDSGEIGPPLVLENTTGLVWTVSQNGTNWPNTGTHTTTLELQWDEVPSYQLGNNT